MRYEYDLQLPAFTAENIDVLKVSRNKGYKHAYRNGRTKHGFLYAASGVLCCTFPQGDTQRLEAHAGDLLFIPKNCVYSCTYLEENTEIEIVQFDLASGTLPAYLSAACTLELPAAGELMNAFFKPLKHTLGHPFYYLSCLYKLLWRIDESCVSIPTKYKKLRSALAELSSGYEKNEKISHYAALCGISEPSFRRLFREYTGLSPVEYRNELRLSSARVMLQSGEYNVSEAAEASGFSNLSFFIRLYKKKYGYTPKKE